MNQKYKVNDVVSFVIKKQEKTTKETVLENGKQKTVFTPGEFKTETLKGKIGAVVTSWFRYQQNEPSYGIDLIETKERVFVTESDIKEVFPQ